jgi:Predicted beta-xylosidase
MKNTMKSKLLLLAVLLIIICASCQPKKKTEPEKEAVTGATYTNPLRERGAEPWAVFYKGKYYYTQGSESRIMLWETSDITNLNDSLRKPVWIPTDPSNSHHLWAPEMHRINNKWYIYFAADDGNMDNHQIYVIENEADIPTEGKFVMKGRIPTDKDNNWAIHASTFEHNGQRYMIWCGWQKRRIDSETQCIYIASMENPWTLSSDRVL